jgi:serine/threonine protein kinase
MHTGDNSPDSLKCPITYELFRDPVIGGDGHTYERENITAWIRKHSTSPITRQPMDLNSLRPNYIVKKLVEDFVSSSLQKQYQFRLDADICKANNQPIFRSPDKTIYKANWMLKHGPPIILITIDGAKATREASFYVKLSCHPHIVRSYGLVDSNSSDSIMLVQEYAPEGDLRKLFRDNNFHPTIEVLLEIFWQIVDAMICLADNQIIHGDLACRNVLVFRSSSNQSTEILVKLTDFGLTRTSSLFSAIDSPALSTMKMIPIRYAAPEILVDTSPNSYSEKSDVYSFGVLMWEACSGGAVPYGDLKTTDNVYEEKLKGKILERPNSCPDELWNIILNCTQHESHERPNFKAVQEALLRLRFQNPRESFNRTYEFRKRIAKYVVDLVHFSSSITNLTDKTRRRSSNQEHIPKVYYFNKP